MYFRRKKYAANRDTFSLFVGVEASATWHPGLSQWRPLSGLFVDSQRLIARSQNRTKCVKYVWLSYPTWPSRWVLCISMQWLRSKGCHVASDEWMSGEICSLQHMWVIGSVMWAAESDESLKFGVQGATVTNWFSRVNGARDNGIWLYISIMTLRTCAHVHCCDHTSQDRSTPPHNIRPSFGMSKWELLRLSASTTFMMCKSVAPS